jgi:hypothetical protein
LLSVHFVGEGVISHGTGDGQIEPTEQLSEALALFLTSEHGEGMTAFGSDSNASVRFHQADDKWGVPQEREIYGRQRICMP